MAKRSIPGSRCLVTGASSGIGRQVVLELARQGADILITARREDRLRELVFQVESLGARALAVAGDLTDATHRDKLLATAREEWGGLDILLNSAGMGAIGRFAEADEQRLRQIMEVNFFAPVELVRGALPLLTTGRRPIIVNVSSVLGHRAVPDKSEYCASKFALHGLSDALRAELANKGIDVLLVSPSTTNTEFFDNVIEGATHSGTVPRRRGMSAAAVARKTVRAIRRGKHEIILSAGGKLLVGLDRVCPPLANWLVARYG